ncbi:phage tail protein [Vibrio fluvialis]|nr:phage tail protein [Vibrio fluvialis]
MHPLRNGSQVTARPARKPTEGTAGYFSESNDNSQPSYPGQDWFNDVIDEFLNALSAANVTYVPGNLTHLAQLFSSVRSQEWSASINYGIGQEVLFSNKRYYAVQPSGPDNDGEQQPDPANVEYWFEVPAVGTRESEYLNIPVGYEIALDDPPPTNDPRFRFVKMTYNDAYNSGVLTSQTLSGTSPELVSTAVISYAQSPINGQTIDMINTMGTFIRPGVTSGVRQLSDNRSHNHTASGTATEFAFLAPGPGRDFKNATVTTSASGGDEARPYNISRIFYKRIY